MKNGIEKPRCLYVLLLVLVCFFCAGLALFLRGGRIRAHARDDTLSAYDPAEEPEETLDGQVAWLCIDGTGIDAPVMQGSDNYEYLNRDPYGNASVSGSIFLDSACAPDFSDAYSLIYGHHMERGLMFGALDAFLDEAYFDSHRTGTLTAVSGQTWNLTLAAVIRTDAEDFAVFDAAGTDVPAVLADIRENALIDRTDGDETHLAALTTCESADGAGRIAVIASLEADSK